MVAVGATPELKLVRLWVYSRPHFVWERLLMLYHKLEAMFFREDFNLMLVLFNYV